MEHRWGRRLPVELAVMIDLGRGLLERGHILNVSASGLLVRMPAGLDLAPHTPVTVMHVERGPGQHRVHHIEATVARQCPSGTGLMFPEFNPPEVAALLYLAGDVSAIPPAGKQPVPRPTDPPGAASNATLGIPGHTVRMARS